MASNTRSGICGLTRNRKQQANHAKCKVRNFHTHIVRSNDDKYMRTFPKPLFLELTENLIVRLSPPLNGKIRVILFLILLPFSKIQRFSGPLRAYIDFCNTADLFK